MSHTTDLIDRFKALKKLQSDYAAAKELGLTHNALSNYRNGISHADDKTAVMLADELGVDRLQTIARINSERAKKPEDRAFWKRIASAAVFVMAVYTSMWQNAHAESDGGHTSYLTNVGQSRHCAHFALDARPVEAAPAGREPEKWIR